MRVAQQIAQTLIDAEPVSIQSDMDDSHWRRVERRPIQALAVDQIGAAGADFRFEHLAVFVVIVAVGLEPEQIPDADAQFGAVHRLGQEVFSAGREALHAGGPVVEIGDHDDGDIPGRRVCLHLGHHLVAVKPRHHDVEQDQIGTIGGDHRECLFAAAGGRQHEALRREHHFEELPVVALVVDDQESRRTGDAVSAVCLGAHRLTSSGGDDGR
jgi:hypothetical protein